jgi:N-acetylglucosaminyldiphosphoundecaprenol N-acetyl-beta-D-mannosaminyltransferase
MFSRQKILGIGFDLVDYRSAFEQIANGKESGKCKLVIMMNPHSVSLCRRDAEVHDVITRADLVLPDGTGIIWASRILGFENRGRVTGPKLMLKICNWGREKKLRHFFYGGAEGVADKLAANLSSKYIGLQVAGTYSPPFRQLSKEEYRIIIDKINSTKPDILWVGLGAPKQEKWMDEHRSKINAAAMIGVGAAFDFHSGNVKWAPEWIRKLGLEWAYRFAQNPKRMWRRNLDSPRFLLNVIIQRLHMLSDNRASVKEEALEN